MTTPSNDVESTILNSAQTMLGSRLDVIRPLAGIVAERKKLQELIDATDKPYGAAYAEALAAGWSTDELLKMGAEEPTRRQPGRPKGSRTRNSRSSGAGTTPGTSSASS